jgi:hypothetical protein
LTRRVICLVFAALAAYWCVQVFAGADLGLAARVYLGLGLAGVAYREVRMALTDKVLVWVDRDEVRRRRRALTRDEIAAVLAAARR